MSNLSQSIHPGAYIQAEILHPRKLTVTEAAKLMGLSRPSLSKFINGKVSTTPEMAERLERSFSVPASLILDMQAKFDAYSTGPATAAQTARAYVPPFLNILANDLITWFSSHIAARSKLSVLLRMLVHSTGYGLTKVDFPGNDDSQRPGWDGFIEASTGTPWIPEGVSGWEFGVEANIKGKADKDFAKRVADTDVNTMAGMTYVFVTPLRWNEKVKWASAMNSKKLWKDVRAYDASDLEQWIEQSLPAQAWFANQTNRSSNGVRTLDSCWSEWADVTDPPLNPAIFSRAIEEWKGRIGQYLRAKTVLEPLILAADSAAEVLAYLSQALASPELIRYRDQVLVFDEPAVFPKLAIGASRFIAVAHRRDVEREFGPYMNSLVTIVVYPRNDYRANAGIVLSPPDHGSLHDSLTTMGKSPEETRKLIKSAGRSLTILRRRLSSNHAIRVPVWADAPHTQRDLIPFALLGAWNASNQVDRDVLVRLAGVDAYEGLEIRFQEFLLLDDPPVWSIDNHQGVISKIDALFAIAPAINPSDLRRFYSIAKDILSEDDPALQLPESERWAAAVYGKRRQYSQVIRAGIAETIVLLAEHGEGLFTRRSNFDGESEAATLVRDVLLPLTTQKLESCEDELALLAEAAPDAFLDILESDLRTEMPAVMGLLRPVGVMPFGSPARTGLLRSLETLAWNSKTFPRVVEILGRLSTVQIDDNWENKPINSLYTIFCSWMPQTWADTNRRASAIRRLAEKYPDAGWKVCIRQFDGAEVSIGFHNSKPKWRIDVHGYEAPTTAKEANDSFVHGAVELALTRSEYSVEMLCDLVERLHNLSPADQQRVWQTIDEWYRAGASDNDIAILREQIRIAVRLDNRRRAAKTEWRSAITPEAKVIVERLMPTDLIVVHDWLFRNIWVDESAGELPDDVMDDQGRQPRIEKLRKVALEEILLKRGTEGIIDLAERGEIQCHITTQVAQEVLTVDQLSEIVLRRLRSKTTEVHSDRLIADLLAAMRSNIRSAVYSILKSQLSPEETLRLLLLAPYEASTWGKVGKLPTEDRQRYWRQVVPPSVIFQSDQNYISIRNLLDAGRPHAAFWSMRFQIGEVEPRLLAQLLFAMAKNTQESPVDYAPHNDDVLKAFRVINRSAVIALEEKAELEFAYIDILAGSPFSRGKHYIPNLEQYIEDHPKLYVQAIAVAFKRRGGSEDSPESKTLQHDEALARAYHRLAHTFRRIPGLSEPTREAQRAKLAHWLTVVRKDCAILDRAIVADELIGMLLSHAPVDPDGAWPYGSVRDVVEELQSEDISKGVTIGLYNSRGFHWRAEGGAQERELANQYRSWADALEFTHPFVSRTVLMAMVGTYEREAEREDADAALERRLL